MVRIGDPSGREWRTTLPKPLAVLIPQAPPKLRYEYSLSNIEYSNLSLNAVLVIRARGENPAERFVINPTRLAEEIVACGGGVFDRQEGSKSQLRFSEDGRDAHRLEDVSYRCAFSNLGCPSAIRIRHWAPAQVALQSNPAANNNNNNSANGSAASKVDPNRQQRRCVECGRKGHRKQCCCDEPGNCRIEIIWAHTHKIDAVPPPPKSGRKRPSMRTTAPQKKPRTAADPPNINTNNNNNTTPNCPSHNTATTCVCAKLGAAVQQGKRQLLAAQAAVHSLAKTVAEIESGNAALDAELRAVALAARANTNANTANNSNNARMLAAAAGSTSARRPAVPGPSTNTNINNTTPNVNGLSEEQQRAQQIEKLRVQVSTIFKDRNPQNINTINNAGAQQRRPLLSQPPTAPGRTIPRPVVPGTAPPRGVVPGRTLSIAQSLARARGTPSRPVLPARNSRLPTPVRTAATLRPAGPAQRNNNSISNTTNTTTINHARPNGTMNNNNNTIKTPQARNMGPGTVRASPEVLNVVAAEAARRK